MTPLVLDIPEIKKIIRKDRIRVIDGGARGAVFKPFDKAEKSLLTIIRFEPDEEAELSLNENEISVPRALWKNDEHISLNIAVDPSTSSVLPFNKELQQYIDPFLELRKTARQVKVKAIAIDTFVKEQDIPSIDFIKLDIHGAEYEALQGSKDSLPSTLGLQVESWILPVHKGQKLRAHVESLLYDALFYVFEEFHYPMWGRNTKKYKKLQPALLDTLFLKDPLIDHNINTEIQALKLIAISDLYGHYGYVEQLTHYFLHKKILSKLIGEQILKHLEDNCTPVSPSFVKAFIKKWARKFLS